MRTADRLELARLKALVAEKERDLRDAQKLGCTCHEEHHALEQAKMQLQEYYWRIK